VAAILAYQAQTVNLREKVAAYVERLWKSLGSWREKDMRRFSAEVTPVIAGAQRQMSAITAASLALQRQAEIGGTAVPTAVDPASVTGAAARNGASPTEVYERPFHLVWRQLAELPREPGSVDKAIESGLNRAVETALTDLQLTKVQTAQAVGEQDKRVRWQQRVLEGPHSCGLCIVASTQTYHNPTRLHPKLLPIHGGCDCSVRFSYGDTYPGQVLDLNTLQDIHARIEERFGASSPGARRIPGAVDGNGLALAYRDVLVTHEHGELGPVLSVKGAPFLGPSNLTH
jgi:hypothetical protein